MADLNLEVERALFEAWLIAGDTFPEAPARYARGKFAGKYVEEEVQLRWEVWQAARAAVPAQAGVGDADELHFNAQRLRNVAALVGVPCDGDDAQVDGVRGALLGQIAYELRKRATAQGDGEHSGRVDEAEKVTCPECKGTGGVRRAGDCSDCNGKGYGWEPVAAANKAQPPKP